MSKVGGGLPRVHTGPSVCLFILTVIFKGESGRLATNNCFPHLLQKKRNYISKST